jgi:hypothetical protein
MLEKKENSKTDYGVEKPEKTKVKEESKSEKVEKSVLNSCDIILKSISFPQDTYPVTSIEKTKIVSILSSSASILNSIIFENTSKNKNENKINKAQIISKLCTLYNISSKRAETIVNHVSHSLGLILLIN